MRKLCLLAIVAISTVLLSSCANLSTSPTSTQTYRVHGVTYHVLASSHDYDEEGYASWYGKAFQHRHTTSGERYNMYAMTAAHKTLPLSTYVQVTNLSNGRKVIVRVNDRGPFVSNRLIDLSYAAAKELGMVYKGTTPVDVKSVGYFG